WCNGPCRSQSMPCLEALDGLGKRVVERTRALLGGEILGHDQAKAQQIVMGAGHADCEPGVRRDGRPAAAYGEIGIAQRRLLDALGRALIESRLVRQRKRLRRTLLGRRDCWLGDHGTGRAGSGRGALFERRLSGGGYRLCAALAVGGCRGEEDTGGKLNEAAHGQIPKNELTEPVFKSRSRSAKKGRRGAYAIYERCPLIKPELRF